MIFSLTQNFFYLVSSHIVINCSKQNILIIFKIRARPANDFGHNGKFILLQESNSNKSRQRSLPRKRRIKEKLVKKPVLDSKSIIYCLLYIF